MAKMENGRTEEDEPVVSFHILSRIRLEHRVLFGLTVLCLLSLFLWIVAVSTSYWVVVHHDEGAYMNKTGNIFLYSRSGIWRLCKTVIKNGTARDGPTTTICFYHKIFPSDEEIASNPEIDRTVIDYAKTEACFSVVSFFLMVLAIGFSLYTFKEPRYMFKRLAGGTHIITAAAVLIVIEVLSNCVKYEAEYLPARHPKGSDWYFHYSYFLAWITFVVYLFTGLVFLVCSRKRKRDKAANEYQAREDEPNILGRL